MPERESSHLGGQAAWMALLDGLCLLVGIAVGILVRFEPEAFGRHLFESIYGWVYYAGSIMVANYAIGSYGFHLRVQHFNMVVNWAFSVLVALLVVSLTSYAWLEVNLGRGVLGIAVAVYSALWLIVGEVVYDVVLLLPAFARRVVVLGTGPVARSLGEVISSAALRPLHRVVAFLHDREDTAPDAPWIDGVPVVSCRRDELAGIVQRYNARILVLGEKTAEYSQIRRLRFEGVAVLDRRTVAEVYLGRIPVELVNESWLLQASLSFSSPVSLRGKRIFDVVLATVGLVLSAPLWLVEAVLVKVSAPRAPILYIQPRTGRFGRPFRMYKFRTMVPTPDRHREEEAAWTADDDVRVTPVGRVLRKYRLDEIPQFLNVLRGEMSLVGPRPEQPAVVEELEKTIPHYRERENVLPGITGWAQIRYPYGATVEDAKRKLEYDLYYIKNLSLGFDLRILLRTLRIVVLGMERTAD